MKTQDKWDAVIIIGLLLLAIAVMTLAITGAVYLLTDLA